MTLKIEKKFQQLYRQLTDEEEKELIDSIEKHGFDPITIDQHNRILDGHNRYRISKLLQIEESDLPTRQRFFENDDECVRYILRLQLSRRNLSQQDFTLALGRLYNSRKPGVGRPSAKKGHAVPISDVDADTLAKEKGVSAKTVKRAGSLAAAYEKLNKPMTWLADNGKLTNEQVKAAAKLSGADQTSIARQIRTGGGDAAVLLKTKRTAAGPQRRSAGKEGSSPAGATGKPPGGPKSPSNGSKPKEAPNYPETIRLALSAAREAFAAMSRKNPDEEGLKQAKSHISQLESLLKGWGKTKAKFIKPTLEEVAQYCAERKNGIDAEEFIAHYSANGWKVGKGSGKPMKDWRQAVITWEKSAKANGVARRTRNNRAAAEEFARG